MEDSIGYPVKLFLSDTILFLQDATALSPSHYCRLTFEIKEEVIYERTPVSSGLGKPVAFVLEREGSSNKLRFSSKDRLIMEKWVE